ncbi:KGK domain-containing protein [Aerosakkonemataceae cyanobacterium BLCC-F50]|uniref:KGK domain-containing protein n=1 Tax=Floridaenema flaviceps BLCC-F50 TaxID=3153642 RepID=A0ABV4Y249_9CYAN
MSNRFQLLDRDDDVLSFEQDKMLKVGQLKEEIRQNFSQFARDSFSYGRNHLRLENYSKLKLIYGLFNEINWQCSPSEGIDCEVLRLGAQNWQKGKLKIQVVLKFLSPLEQQPLQYVEAKKMDDKLREKNLTISEIMDIKVILEFCPDTPEIIEPESPLDDLRRMMNENSK